MNPIAHIGGEVAGAQPVPVFDGSPRAYRVVDERCACGSYIKARLSPVEGERLKWEFWMIHTGPEHGRVKHG